MVIWRTIRKLFFSTYARGFVSSYLLFMVIGAAFLKLPISLQSDQSLSWVDAFFVSASGLSTTGLSTIVVKDVFSRFGLTVLILIIQVGGIGLIMMVSLFWLVVRKKITFSERNMIMTDQNQLSRQGIVRFVRNVLIMILIIEIIGFLVMSSYFIMFTDYFTTKEAIYQAFFTTISLFTNAGFDIAPGGDSFQMYANDYTIQSLAMGLMFLGAVGFWPLYELREWFVHTIKRKPEKYKFTVFTKTLVVLHLFLWLISTLYIFLAEHNHFLADKGTLEGVYYSFFMALTTRNAGFSTMDVTQFTSATQLVFVVLMFIGSSPNSAGGGIRTTTLLVTLLGIRAFARNRRQVLFQNRHIKEGTVHKSFIVVLVAIFILVIHLIVLSLVEPYETKLLAFELVSAFGTTGLSLGITSELGSVSRVILIVTMFIGRIGIAALLLMFAPEKRPSGTVKYPEMDIIIG